MIRHNDAGSMRLFLLWGCLFFFVSMVVNVGFSKPVVVELFTSDAPSCANCQYAEDALLRLRGEYSRDDLHIIVYHLNDALESFYGVLRRSQYKVDESRLPIMFFNGLNRIDGAKSTIYHSYKDNIDDFLLLESPADIHSWMELSSGTLVTEATFQIPPSQIIPTYESVYTLTENLPGNQISVLRYIERTSDSLQAGEGTISRTVELTMPIYETNTEVIWMIQNSNSLEIIQSHRAQNKSPIRWDTNNDGFLNKHDVLFLPFVWHTSSVVLDINGDGIVDSYDLLLFLGRDI